MKHLVLPFSGLFLVCLLASCTKDPVRQLSTEESRIYITNHDSTVHFSNFLTFSIADSVAVIQDGQLLGKSKDPVDTAFISALAANLRQRGFTQVAKDAHPDLGLNINRIYSTYTGLVNYGSYYGGYGGYWDPYYWGYAGYPYYGSFVGVYQFTDGAVSIDMFDLKDATANNDLKAVWNGLIRGSGIFDPQTAASQVKALFDQSPYLSAQ
jgi:hypothetical protein